MVDQLRFVFRVRDGSISYDLDVLAKLPEKRLGQGPVAEAFPRGEVVDIAISSIQSSLIGSMLTQTGARSAASATRRSGARQCAGTGVSVAELADRKLPGAGRHRAHADRASTASDPPTLQEDPCAKVENRLRGGRNDQRAQHDLGDRPHGSLDQQRVDHTAKGDDRHERGMAETP